jgi:hypothetical protein
MLLLAAVTQAETGKPFEDSAAAEPGAAWDLTKPLWVLFAQERVLLPESPDSELYPRAAVAYYRPIGGNKRLFLILAGVAYLVNIHREEGGLETEASIFTMLMPVGSSLYRDGAEVPQESFDEVWTDSSLRATRTWGKSIRFRVGTEYQAAFRDYRVGEDTDAAFVLPHDTLVHQFDLNMALDTRARGRTGDYNRGFELFAGVTHEIRDDWNAWGMGGVEFSDPDAKQATTAFATFECHKSFDARDAFVLHVKARAAKGWNLDRLTYIRLGGGGFGRQFDRVGAGSTGAANDGELLRSDGVPGYFGGEFFTDEYAQLNFEMDLPAGASARFHLYGAGALFRDLLQTGAPDEEIYGFGLGYTRVFNAMTRGFRLDLGYSPLAERDGGSTEFTVTYLQLF